MVNDKILLGKRARGRGVNQYALVGGKPEEGESVENAIVREVNEELGILFNDVKLWKKELDKDSVPGELWDVYYFYGKGDGGLNLKKDEILDTILVSKENLPDIDLAFDHRKILEEFFNDAI